MKLFTFRTSETTTTTTTTTPKPKSLQELLERSHGIRENTNKPSSPSSTASTSTTTEQTRKSFRNQLASSLRAKLKAKSKQEKESDEKEQIEAGKKVPETNRISQSYQDRFKLKDLPIKNDDVTKFLPKDYQVSPSLNNDKNGGALLAELLSSLNGKDIDELRKELTSSTTASSSPSTSSRSSSSSNRFTPRAPSRDFSKGYRKPSSSGPVQIDDISKFLPADYSTSTTEAPKLGISNLFENIEVQSELPASLLPKDYKPKFTPKIKQDEIPLDLLPKDYPKDLLNIEQVSLPDSLLPKDYKKPKIVQEELPSSLLPKDFKIQSADPSLLPPGYPSSIEVQEDLPPSLLPPGYKPPAQQEPAIVSDPSLLPKDFKIDPKLLPKDYKLGEEKEASQPKQEEKKLIKLNFW